ncbi:hypothetical protein TTHERM_00423360 (macronuclear) [Tetrahymena thermophila SB210]|uniref:Zinc carboxypeptidase family protein n=1 Tax=Tetrahymena thermophila (strain SB210) TaxID=312017 RepID=Q23AM5_TETTS|nr:hypothetical protein TTHERM_00423360 [Tetrahymena thermophila SB210]EAR93467.1 hypothetical protein TTHERM_00423360 [Tetrahymena thermophila SB210]|eukprot:XP_001013712.1 hypothetical protein TTHERM_00423360 [Tetrahymena thermophila SB210]
MEREKKQSKCDIHPNFNNNFLLFEEDNIHTKICLVCAKKLTKDVYKIIDHDEFLFADQYHIFSSFPPLEDEKIYNIIQNLQIQKANSIQEYFVEKINNYFTSLKKQINQKIDLLQNQVKQKLISQMDNLNQDQGDKFLKIYNEVSSKFDIQQLLKEHQEDSEQSIKEIIKKKYQNIKENTDKLQKSIAEYQKIINKVDLTIPNQIQQKILNLIDDIDFFSNNNIGNIEFEKSKSYGSSQNLQIQRLLNREIQITQSIDSSYGVSYANFILDPNQKYIFRVKLQTNSDPNSFLLIGIIKEQDKDNQKLYNTICYNERGDLNTITKVVKGKDVFEGTKKNIDKEIEVRIHLAQKMIKVANYPNYENIAELQNNQLILENTQYRFAVELYSCFHKIIITHIQLVDEFNQNM